MRNVIASVAKPAVTIAWIKHAREPSSFGPCRFFIDTAFLDMIAERGCRNLFQGNRSRLRIESYAMRSTMLDWYSEDRVQRARLSGVTSLDMSCRSPEHDGRVDRTVYPASSNSFES